jgi:hypothetical protein
VANKALEREREKPGLFQTYIPHPNLSIFDYFLFLLKQTDGSV